MKKLGLTLVMAMMAVMLVAGGAWAIPLNVSNLNLTDLQGVFDGIGSNIVASGANNDESQSEVFAFQSTSAGAVFVASASWSQAQNLEFGMYDILNPDTQLTLFNTNPNWPQPADDAQIYINFNSGSVTAYTMDGGYSVVDQETFASQNLGFYITSPDYNPGTYYSQSDMNGNNGDRFLTYMGRGDYVTIGDNPSLNDLAHWYIAAEAGDSTIPGDLDFSDFVVQLESVQPVPEPGTMALLGIGLLGLAFVGRKKLKIEE